LHAGAFQVGLLATIGYLPLALFGLPAGVWADRLPRRRIMLAADIARGLVLASIPMAYLFGHLQLAQLYVVTFCVGGLSVFFDVASPAYLPSLVGGADLAAANSRLQVTEQGAGVIGPGLAGWLIGLAGAPMAITADAASYLASAAFVSRIKQRDPSPPSAPAGRTNMGRELLDGIRAVTRQRQLRAIAVCTALINLFGRTMVILIPLYLVRDAGYRPAGIGIVFSLGAIGFLIGAAGAERTIARLGLGTAIVTGAVIASASLLLIAIPPASLAGPWTAAALFIYGIGALTFTVSNGTLRQLTIPSELLGRTTATMRMLTWIAQPVAGLLAAWWGTNLGLHAALWIGALGALLAPIPLLTARLARHNAA
jgi:MFS family permease